MYPVPTIAELSAYSGRPEETYTAFGTNALIQATIMWTAVTEITDPIMLASDDQTLAQYGICAMADYIYLRQPYQQVIANPMQNETIGSYTYSKPMAEMARNAQAMEVMSESTGVTMYDLAVRLLSVRTRAGGVFTGGMTVFERTGRTHGGEGGRGDRMAVRFDGAGLFCDWDGDSNRWQVRGPDEFNLTDFQMFDMNTEMFPADPGVG
jgi:hypothetical protein